MHNNFELKILLGFLYKKARTFLAGVIVPKSLQQNL